ncbi:hypothetical protein [Flavobacterium sp. I3-2]|uniref:hypothetical protein n=1 Tax=Flavobacterium sp. I3-2 TaxID=2748319 RepID=UPI002103F55E|nr:hypothetical protein [Flavobacterium sp. I3-2]
MTPYQYVHNNPVNLVDPTEMEDEGNKNVNSVSEKLYFTDLNTNESYNLNKDGSVTNNTNSTTNIELIQ